MQLSGKTALITGATSGIGYYTALELAKLGAQVVVGARTEARGREAMEKIQRESPGAEASYLVADLSSMDQVRALAERYRERHSKLHLLVNNAGTFFMRHQLSVDGLEMTFAVNHLAPFLLTNLLLDAVTDSAPARIVNVSSVAHRGARMRFDDLGLSRGYGFGWRAYGQSKLANLLFTYELHRRLAGSGVTANALHPGFVRTGLGTKHVIWPLRPFVAVSFLWGMSPEAGAATSIKLASDSALEGISGKYYVAGRQIRSSTRSYDEQAARRLWEISAKLTGLG